MRSPEEVAERLSAIAAEEATWAEQSAACPHCAWGCECDGDWSPEARLRALDDERAALRATLQNYLAV